MRDATEVGVGLMVAREYARATTGSAGVMVAREDPARWEGRHHSKGGLASMTKASNPIGSFSERTERTDVIRLVPLCDLLLRDAPVAESFYRILLI